MSEREKAIDLAISTIEKHVARAMTVLLKERKRAMNPP